MHAVLHNMLYDIFKVELADAVDFKAAPSGAVMHMKMYRLTNTAV